VVFAGALSFGPFVTATIAGQVSTVLAALVMGAGALALGGEDGWCAAAVGAVLTIVVLVKPFYAPIGAVLLRDWRRMAGAVATGTALIAAGVLVFGVDTSAAYLGVLQQGKGWGTAIDPVRTWNINEYHPLYALQSVHLLVRAGVFAAVSGVALYSRRAESRTVDGLVFSLGICAFALAAPTVAPHALTVLVPVFLFVLWTTGPAIDQITVATLCALVLVHVHSYVVEFLVTFGPRLIGSESLIYDVVPAVQPAVWGVVVLSGIVTVRIAAEFDARAVS